MSRMRLPGNVIYTYMFEVRPHVTDADIVEFERVGITSEVTEADTDQLKKELFEGLKGYTVEITVDDFSAKQCSLRVKMNHKAPRVEKPSSTFHKTYLDGPTALAVKLERIVDARLAPYKKKNFSIKLNFVDPGVEARLKERLGALLVENGLSSDRINVTGYGGATGDQSYYLIFSLFKDDFDGLDYGVGDTLLSDITRTLRVEFTDQAVDAAPAMSCR
jgi:hypothetical protein